MSSYKDHWDDYGSRVLPLCISRVTQVLSVPPGNSSDASTACDL